MLHKALFFQYKCCHFFDLFFEENVPLFHGNRGITREYIGPKNKLYRKRNYSRVWLGMAQVICRYSSRKGGIILADIADIFLKASARKDLMVGEIVKDAEYRADKAFKERVRQSLDELVTSIQFLLQARMNRQSGTGLNQIKTKDIQGNLKTSLTDKIEETKDLAAKEFAIFYEYFSECTLNLTSQIDDKAWQVIVAVQDYSLANDFDSRFAFYLKDLDNRQLDAVLKLLVLSHIKQRLERCVGLDSENDC